MKIKRQASVESSAEVGTIDLSKVSDFDKVDEGKEMMNEKIREREKKAEEMKSQKQQEEQVRILQFPRTNVSLV